MIRVRITSSSAPPARSIACRMISRHRCICPATSPGWATEPSSAIGAVPDTAINGPIRTAREKPIDASNGEPDEIFMADVTGDIKRESWFALSRNGWSVRCAGQRLWEGTDGGRREQLRRRATVPASYGTSGYRTVEWSQDGRHCPPNDQGFFGFHRGGTAGPGLRFEDPNRLFRSRRGARGRCCLAQAYTQEQHGTIPALCRYAVVQDLPRWGVGASSCTPQRRFTSMSARGDSLLRPVRLCLPLHPTTTRTPTSPPVHRVETSGGVRAGTRPAER